MITQQPQTGLISRFYRQVENRLKNKRDRLCSFYFDSISTDALLEKGLESQTTSMYTDFKLQS